jgi:single-strand DNA-binding protein
MFHRVTIIGRVGQDPTMRYTPDGTPVCNFSVAASRTISKATREQCPAGWKESYNGKNWEKTLWFRVTCWRGLAETVNAWLSKGRQVFVEGELNGDVENGTQNPRVWQDNNGVHRASYEITADTVKFLGGRNDNGGNGAPAEGGGGGEEDLGDLPF